MKRFVKFLIILCLFATVFGIAACQPTNDPYANYNSIVRDDYASAVITVKTEQEHTLSATLNVTFEGDKANVNYTCVQYAKFDANGNLPADILETVTGTAVVQNGKIVSQNGATTDIALEKILASGLNFKQEYFSEPQMQAGSFSAKVKNPIMFTGDSSLVCTDMTVKLTATTFETKIEIAYVADNGAAVTINYVLAR